MISTSRKQYPDTVNNMYSNKLRRKNVKRN